MLNELLKGVLLVVGIIVMAFIIFAIGAWPTMLLWNWLMPTIFGLTTITYWQSFGLLWLTTLLFRSGMSNSKS